MGAFDMATACLEQGAIVQIEGIEHRLSRKIDDCWQLEQSKTGRVAEYEQQDFVAHVCGAKADLSWQRASKQMRARQLRRVYGRPRIGEAAAQLCACRPEYSNSRNRLEEAIHAAWKRVKVPQRAPGWITVYRWKCRFLRANGDVRALVDDTRSKGNQQSRYPAMVIELCEQSISTKYLNRTRNSIQQTLEDALRRVKRENELRPACDALPLPTRRLITRMIASIPAFDKRSARYGHDSAVKEFAVSRVILSRRRLLSGQK